jgi:hypothetical protein
MSARVEAEKSLIVQQVENLVQVKWTSFVFMSISLGVAGIACTAKQNC